MFKRKQSIDSFCLIHMFPYYTDNQNPMKYQKTPASNLYHDEKLWTRETEKNFNIPCKM